MFSRDLTVLPAHPNVQSAIAMSHTGFCLLSYSWYSFTDPGGMEGWVSLSGWLCSETIYLPEGSHPSHYNRAQCRPTALTETNALLLHFNRQSDNLLLIFINLIIGCRLRAHG